MGIQELRSDLIICEAGINGRLYVTCDTTCGEDAGRANKKDETERAQKNKREEVHDRK